MLGIGDSTQAGVGDTGSTIGATGSGWNGRLWTRIGADYNYSVRAIGYLNSALGWNAGGPLTLRDAGSGRPNIYMYGGGGSGTTILGAQAQVDGGMLTQLAVYGAPDVVIINDGYNSINLTGDPDFVAHFQTLVASVQAAFPTVPVIITTQNIFGTDVGNQAGAMGPWFANLAVAYGLSPVTTGASTGRPGLTPALQQTNAPGVWMLDTRQATKAIVDAGNYSSVTFDGIHSNGYGYDLQYLFMYQWLVTNVGGTGDPPTITTGTLNALEQGTAFSQSLAASGTTPISWSLQTGAIPSGLTLSTTGTISGTPDAAGAYDFTVRATNAYGHADKRYTGTITGVITHPFAPDNITQLKVKLNGQWYPVALKIKVGGQWQRVILRS